MHGLDRGAVVAEDVLLLLLDDFRRHAAFGGIVQQQVVLQLVDILPLDAQRIDDHAVVVELHVVESSESGGVLVLLASGHAQLVALDPIGPLRDVVTSERQPQPLGERSEYRDDERRRRAESRAGRRVHERVEREAAFDRAELRHDMVVYSLVQVEHPVDRQLGLQLVAQRLVAVQSPQHDLRLVRRLDRGMGVQRDRRVENGPSVQVRVGTDVRSPSG